MTAVARSTLTSLEWPYPAGLPIICDAISIGLQAIGPYLEDSAPLRFAALVARERGGFEPPPRYALMR
jgi:Asp-tRNA(Asn)/Glu-tRNA(Gln) amidotransferase A subunit family amidase